MEYFYPGGGADPTFQYRYKIKEVTNEMHEWCRDYDDEGKCFRRWHINYSPADWLNARCIIQFEWEQAALMFSLKFGDYIQ